MSVWIKAAENLALTKEEFDSGKPYACCPSIKRVENWKSSHLESFRSFFMPSNLQSYEPWWSGSENISDKSQLARSLALILMHEMKL